jgi:hypothetical protein
VLALVRLLCWPTSRQQTLQTLQALSAADTTGEWTLAHLRTLALPRLTPTPVHGYPHDGHANIGQRYSRGLPARGDVTTRRPFHLLKPLTAPVPVVN